jgi:hypothetical protein
MRDRAQILAKMEEQKRPAGVSAVVRAEQTAMVVQLVADQVREEDG